MYESFRIFAALNGKRSLYETLCNYRGYDNVRVCRMGAPDSLFYFGTGREDCPDAQRAERADDLVRI